MRAAFAPVLDRHAICRLCFVGDEGDCRWRDFPPVLMALPRPSGRTMRWPCEHPRFEQEVLPELRARVARTVSPTPRCAPCRRR
jgi:hypothetical protein